MREIKISTNAISDGINKLDVEHTEGINVVLVDGKDIPIARYCFEKEKLHNISEIKFKLNGVKIDFTNIIPSTKYELCSIKE